MIVFKGRAKGGEGGGGGGGILSSLINKFFIGSHESQVD